MPIPFLARVVEVLADEGNDVWGAGSGLIVGQRYVLTCAHVVANAVAAYVRRTDKVKLTVDLTQSLIGPPNALDLDLALLYVPEAPELPDI